MITLYTLVRFLCLCGIIYLLYKNEITYEELDFWLIMTIILVYGFSEFIEQMFKRYR